MLPMLLRIKLISGETHFGMYIPLILVYILLIPAFAIGIIVYALMLTSVRTIRARSYMKIAFNLPALLVAAKGMELVIRSGNSENVTLFIK